MVQLEHNTVTWTQLSLLHFLPLVMGGEEVKNNIPRTLLQLLCNQQNCIKYIWSVVTVPLLLPKIELNKTRAFYFFLFFKKRTSHLVQCLIIQLCVPALPYSEARQTVWYWTTAAMSESEEQKLVYFIVQRPSLIHTHTFHKAQPTEQHLAMHSLLLLQSTARGGKRLAAVWHYGNASGGFSDSSPSMEMSVHEDEAITQLSELLLSFVLLRSLPGPKPVSSAKCWRAKGIQAVPFQLLSSQVFLILIFA